MTNYTDWYYIIDNDYPLAVPDSCCDGPICGLQGYKVAYDEVKVSFKYDEDEKMTLIEYKGNQGQFQI